MRAQLEDTVEELHQTLEQMHQEYETKLNEMESERVKKNKETVADLETLLKEMTYPIERSLNIHC